MSVYKNKNHYRYMRSLVIVCLLLVGLLAASCTKSACAANRKGYKKKWNYYNRIQYQ
ncbi:MAG: hypothetical protein RMJ44_06635 [Cytophagales bacterium]|nr:hypothetical protein [Bernardetiaceae bacterium]MDW8210748.1 hypothetical protein [Cytophagales bacterium]